ncbi:glycosyltransferase family 2 protein, partial [Candidatus Roizmanbacteria bacterium]|nr:glycosyltransferase family 2 protein [Candidatus Roizmanbacteria bacterium]
MKTAIIFVLYKTPDSEVDRLRRETRDAGFEEREILFIDNTKENRGYAFGVNRGVRIAIEKGFSNFVIANPDISLKNIRKAEMLEGSKHFDLWGLAMKMHGKIYYGGVTDRFKLTAGLNEKSPPQRFTSVPWISGSLFILKKRVIDEIGYFDESFFMYYEDVDYCLRAKKAGFSVGLDSKTVYEHYEVSLSKNGKDRLLAKAYQLFYKKHAGILQTVYEWIPFFSLNISSLYIKLLNFF